MAEKVDDLYVVTENGEQCFMWRSNQLTYIATDRQELPSVLAHKFGPLATKLDLSYNHLTSFKNINQFVNLNELVLDNNNLSDAQLDFKQNLRLKTLSLNKNKLVNLHGLINSIKFCFPNLEYLSLIGNPLCPSSICTFEEEQPGFDNVSYCQKDVKPNGSLENSDRQLCRKQVNLSATLAHRDSSPMSYQKYRHFIIYHLPNLRFLDSSPISGKERDEALRRCFWMSANVNHLSPVVWQGRPADTVENERGFNNIERAIEINSGASNGVSTQARASELKEIGNGNFQLTIMTSEDINEQQRPQQQQQQHHRKGIFARLRYKYMGTNSEGNIFIRNQDL